MKIKYIGTADVKGFSKEDFAKADVESEDLWFNREEVVEVPDEVGALLTADEGLFGTDQFDMYEGPSEEELEALRKSDVLETNFPDQVDGNSADAGEAGVEDPNAAITENDEGDAAEETLSTGGKKKGKR